MSKNGCDRHLKDDKAGVFRDLSSLDLQALVRDQELPVKGRLKAGAVFTLYLPEKVGQEPSAPIRYKEVLDLTN